MKKLIYLSLIGLSLSCTKKQDLTQVDTKSDTLGTNLIPAKKELFTSTQRYEILCWTIKSFEGYSATSYRCSANKRTIAWGFCRVKSVKNIHHADEIFKRIVASLFKDVSKAYPNLNYLSKCAIISLLYNSGDLDKIKRSGFSRQLNKRNIDDAIVRFKQWSKVRIDDKLITIKGLKNRRTFESKLLDGSFDMEDYLKLKSDVASIYLKNKQLENN